MAKALHQRSGRVGPWVVVDCSAIPEHLVESELFGHVAGAFTGATRGRVGAIEAANEGTVFLDEIGELPVNVQPKLLRFLESKTVRRVGETEHREVDVRVVTATHRNLLEMLNDGTFREDLYFRIAVLPLQVPALRERPEDIPLLIQSFLNDEQATKADELARQVRDRVWPGNVRELRNFIERAVALGSRQALDLTPPSSTNLPAVALERPFKELRREWLDHLERTYIVGMMAQHGRSLAAIAEASGLDRSYVYRLMRKHEL